MTPDHRCVLLVAPIGIGITTAIWILLVYLQQILPLPRLGLSVGWRWGLGLLFCFDALGTLIWGALTLAKAREEQHLATTGPYALMRHPMYSAIVFSGTATVAFLFQSWVVLLGAVPLHLIWMRLVRAEETDLCRRFGQDYIQYAQETGQFFPRLASLKKATQEPTDLEG